MDGIERFWAASSLGASYYIGLALLVVLLVVALVQAYRVWEEIHDVEEPDSAADLLESFEQAHGVGALDDQELDRVRRRLAGAPAPDGGPGPRSDPLPAKPIEGRPAGEPDRTSAHGADPGNPPPR